MSFGKPPVINFAYFTNEEVWVIIGVENISNDLISCKESFSCIKSPTLAKEHSSHSRRRRLVAKNSRSNEI